MRRSRWYTDERVEVETRYRGTVVTVALELYPSSGSDKLDDPAAVLDKLTTLTRQALTRLKRAAQQYGHYRAVVAAATWNSPRSRPTCRTGTSQSVRRRG